MIIKVLIVCLLVTAVCLLIVDISERHSSERYTAETSTTSTFSPPIILSSDYPYPMREINYISHISGRVTVMNNPDARDVSYSEMVSFLLEDQTDKITYSENSFSCPDFSQILQHNAEKKGIRCAWVYVDLLETIDHSCNAFMTTDRGLIFIDDSGVVAGMTHPFNMDKIVVINRGQGYCPESLFPETGWTSKWNCTGTIVDYKLYWVGDM